MSEINTENSVNLGQEQASTEGTEQKQELSVNGQAKQLPWVQDLMKKAKEFDQMVEAQKAKEAEAEKMALVAKGEYEQALELEKQARLQAEQSYKKELIKIKLDAEFDKAGIIDPRMVSIFENGYESEVGSVVDYVAKIKADPANSHLFGQQQRQVSKPPADIRGVPDDFVPERDLHKWLRSKDQAKRERAIAHNRQKYSKQFKNKLAKV